VLEIGAGTGAITRHIPIRAREYFVAIFEQDQRLAKHLREQISGVPVIEGFFHETIKEIKNLPDNLIIVSSIPFKSLSEGLRFRTIEAICTLLVESPKRRLIQYTYFNCPPFAPHYTNLHWRRLTRVWANLPPATVWELRADIGLSNRR